MADGGTVVAVYDAHDQAVMQRVNRWVAKANADMAKGTVAEKLEWAWSQNIAEREKDSTNVVGRDADYYLAARHEIAKDKSKAAKYAKWGVGIVATGVYNGLKVVTGAVGADKVMRTDKDKPNAPPGGFTWMNRGARDGMKDRGEDRGPALLHQPDGAEPAPGQ
jgi:hypothetical protein